MDELIKAIRQYKHNDGSSGFVIAYDKGETEKVIAELKSQVEFKIKECQELAQACNRYKSQLRAQKVSVLSDLRDSIQPDGLINSDAGTRTINAITCAINAIIDLEVGT